MKIEMDRFPQKYTAYEKLHKMKGKSQVSLYLSKTLKFLSK